MSGMVMQKHSRMPRKSPQERVRAKSTRGHAGGAPIPIERREAIVEAAKRDILAGKTIDQIASEHGIAHSTLEYWLSALGDEYQELRDAWLDGMLIEAGTLLKEAPDALGLARARELWKRATWYAERRSRARYGIETNVNINIGVDLGDRLRRARERVIDAVQQTTCLSDAEISTG